MNGAGEDLFGHLRRTAGGFDPDRYRRLLGAANPFKEGDRIAGVAAADETERALARTLLARTRVGDIEDHPPFRDDLWDALEADVAPFRQAGTGELTLARLKDRILGEDPGALRPLLAGLGSDVIACLVKLMDDRELTRAGAHFCTALPGSHIGAPGYLGARVQPNSPTDHPDDIVWQVFSAWSFAVGDLLLGTNPASSSLDSLAPVEAALQDLIATFGLEAVLPHCVLAHIELQAELERRAPDSTGIWFQSLGGSTTLNATFGLTLARLLELADQRSGRFGLYLETGQGADFSNGHSHGTDMVILEGRKYGLVRLLQRRVGRAQARAGRAVAPWVHVNDVAGFIGPEVFRTREQLVRCCLEDLVMGKLHGLTIGLDICSTLHMDLALDDLAWCQDRLAPAAPAYLMALPTRNDPMLGYLTTSFQDHVRLRERFGTRVDEAMWAFFQRLGVVDGAGRPTARFGQPLEVWRQYRRLKGDGRPEGEILAEGRARMAAVRGRGVPLAEGHGRERWDLPAAMDRDLALAFADARAVLRDGFSPAFLAALGPALALRTRSADRDDYLAHPHTGEGFDEPSLAAVRSLAAGRPEVQVLLVVSDGLNAHALMDPGHLDPYLAAFDAELGRLGLARVLLAVANGRVRAGYRLGEAFFAQAPDAPRAVLHLIGERPGSLHHTFSAYLTVLPGRLWQRPGTADHDRTRLVSGIADTALDPALAARETAALLASAFRA